MALAPDVPVQTRVTALPLEQADDALAAMRSGAGHGALVLVVEGRVAAARSDGITA